MTFIVYDDNPKPHSGGRFDFDSADATKFYLEHYSNYMMLKFMAQNELSTFSEKTQARKELVICERKMEWWRRHHNFDTNRANEGITKIQKDWR